MHWYSYIKSRKIHLPTSVSLGPLVVSGLTLKMTPTMALKKMKIVDVWMDERGHYVEGKSRILLSFLFLLPSKPLRVVRFSWLFSMQLWLCCKQHVHNPHDHGLKPNKQTAMKRNLGIATHCALSDCILCIIFVLYGILPFPMYFKLQS